MHLRMEQQFARVYSFSIDDNKGAPEGRVGHVSVSFLSVLDDPKNLGFSKSSSGSGNPVKSDSQMGKIN